MSVQDQLPGQGMVTVIPVSGGMNSSSAAIRGRSLQMSSGSLGPSSLGTWATF